MTKTTKDFSNVYTPFTRAIYMLGGGFSNTIRFTNHPAALIVTILFQPHTRLSKTSKFQYA